MYLTTAWSMVKAYDIHTGAQLWAYDPKIDRAKGADACCDVVNRGVAAWNGKIYLGALDGRLIALDGKTGKEVWSKQTTDTTLPYTITGVPRIVKGKVIIGNGGAEYRVRGYITAYDAETGEQAWRWYDRPRRSGQRATNSPNSPKPARPGMASSGSSAAAARSGTAWPTIPSSTRIYVGTGNGTPWNQKIRSPGGGDNLFLSSIVALDPNTGKYKWHYQTTPGETWDYTATQPIMVADLNYPEGKRRVVMQAPKNGFFYVLDAKTGKLLSAEKFAPAHLGHPRRHDDRPPGRSPRSPLRHDRQARDRRPRRPRHAQLASDGVQPGDRPRLPAGHVSSSTYASPENFEVNLKGWNTGIGFNAAAGVTPVAATGTAPKHGQPTSSRGIRSPAKEVWRVPEHRSARRAPAFSPPPATSIFSGNHDGEFIAYDARTGKKLWSAPTQARVVAAPATFTVDGQQQVAILVGARGLPVGQKRTVPVSANNSRILVFRIGGAAALPDRDADDHQRRARRSR